MECTLYSVVSNKIYKSLVKLAEICGRDIGNRGVENLKVEGDLKNAADCLALSEANNIALTTGVPFLTTHMMKLMIYLVRTTIQFLFVQLFVNAYKVYLYR